jgi:hypothetical protein
VKFIKVLLSIILASLAISASAAGAPDRGKWLCGTCELSPPATAMDASDLGEAWAFIRSTVNTQTGTSWQQNELVTICDGTSCVTLGFQALGCACWMPLGPTYKDDGHNYKNAQVDKNPPPATNHDSGTSLAYRIFYSLWSYITGTPKVVTPIVEVHQLNLDADLESAGFGDDFGSAMVFDSNNSTFSFGNDFPFAGANAETATGTIGSTGGVNWQYKQSQ